MLNVKINGQDIQIAEGTTIMAAAETLGINIPRLCYHPDLSLEGACRVCIVEVKGMPHYMASCSVRVWDGMEVQTNSPVIRQARRDIVELLLDNHPKECQTCERNGNCELQKLAYDMGVRERYYEGRRKHYKIDDSGSAVIRNPEKCILCGRCVRVCSEIQGVNNLSQHHRGFNTVVGPSNLVPMDDSVCIQCGQCINVCPTAAFLETRHTDAIWEALSNPDLHVVVQTAPSIRAAIGEGFGLPPGTPATEQMITALRRLGFSAIFDTNFGADMTIMEEAHELLERLKGKGPLPLLTSCSPGWINFMEKFYPELIPLASTCKSPMSMLSTLCKTYYAEKKGLDPKKIFMVGVMPCVAKKFESRRKEHMMPDGRPWTDAVLTTRELIWMIKCYGIDFTSLPGGEFDRPLGLSTGAADIFGTTGGVMEAAIRTAAEWATGERLENLEYTDVRAVEGIREATLKVGDISFNVGVANGINNAKTILDRVKAGEKQYHLIEIMACPGGCIGGGGQPYPPEGMKVMDPELYRLRAKALYYIDQHKQLRRSHENPAIMALYNEFLGEIGGRKSHQLLHTHYQPKLPRGIK